MLATLTHNPSSSAQVNIPNSIRPATGAADDSQIPDVTHMLVLLQSLATPTIWCLLMDSADIVAHLTSTAALMKHVTATHYTVWMEDVLSVAKKEQGSATTSRPAIPACFHTKTTSASVEEGTRTVVREAAMMMDLYVLAQARQNLFHSESANPAEVGPRNCVKDCLVVASQDTFDIWRT